MGDGHNSEGLTLEDFFSAVKRLCMRVEKKVIGVDSQIISET